MCIRNCYPPASASDAWSGLGILHVCRILGSLNSCCLDGSARLVRQKVHAFGSRTVFITTYAPWILHGLQRPRIDLCGDRVSLMLCLHHHRLSQLCTAVFATAIILVRLGTGNICAVRPVDFLSANSLVQSRVNIVVDGLRVLVG